MQFIKQTENLSAVLTSRLTNALTKCEKVIWLVPGGSNIPTSVEAMAGIDESRLARLTIMQTDERFVPLDSPDCNWKQLLDGGFDVKKANTFPILTGADGLEETVETYTKTLRRAFENADHIIGQFGIGPDGHIAGIKPHSVAAESQELVCGYEAEDFTRITITFPAIKQINEILVFASGENKQDALERIYVNNEPLEKLPASIVCTTMKSTIYNDQIEK